MNPYLNISFRTFTIWIMSALINGILCGIYFPLSHSESDPIVEMICISVFCSLVFAAPGFFLFWIAMLIMVSKQFYERRLFRAALSTGIILSLCIAFFTFKLFKRSEGPAISIFIILSAIMSIMLHFKAFKKIGSNKNKTLYTQHKIT